MARARAIRSIQPKESLRENARRVIAVRLEELLSWRASLEDPSLVRELHDMRIAAKRLRYALEVFEVCFPEVRPVLRQVTSIQEDLGTIHDLDVLVEILRQRLGNLDGQVIAQAANIRRSAGDARERSNRLRQLLYAEARDRRRLGLLGLIGDKMVQREEEYARFTTRWGKGLDELAADLMVAIGGQQGAQPNAAAEAVSMSASSNTSRSEAGAAPRAEAG